MEYRRTPEQLDEKGKSRIIRAQIKFELWKARIGRLSPDDLRRVAGERRIPKMQDFIEHFEDYIVPVEGGLGMPGIIAINKPHDLVTISTEFGEPGIAELVQLATGNPDLSPIHRLDRTTSGLLVLGTRCKTIELI